MGIFSYQCRENHVPVAFLWCAVALPKKCVAVRNVTDPFLGKVQFPLENIALKTNSIQGNLRFAVIAFQFSIRHLFCPRAKPGAKLTSFRQKYAFSDEVTTV